MSTIIGLSDERSVVISEWIGELESSCSKTRGIALAALLGEALESYVWVEKEILADWNARAAEEQARKSPFAQPQVPPLSPLPFQTDADESQRRV